MIKNKNAFTLAEVLIIIGVIGVIAAFTIPTLIANINKKVKDEKIKVIKSKITQGTSILSTQNGLGPYYGETKDGTELFFLELSKYMKIIKICDRNNINECISYENVVKTNGEIKSVSEYFTDNGSGVGMFDNINHKYGKVVSIILADGTPFVLTYDLKCPISDPDSRNDNPTACLHGWFDVNGYKGPNKWGEDIISFNYGYGKIFTPTAITANECGALKQQLGIKSCLYNGDYWAGAVKECGDVSNMVTAKDLTEIVSSLYKTSKGYVQPPELGVWVDGNNTPGLTYSPESNPALAGVSYIFSGTEINYVHAYTLIMNNAGRTQAIVNSQDRRNSYVKAICKGD